MVEQKTHPTDFELDSMVKRIEEFGEKFIPAKGKYYVILDDFQTSIAGVELSDKHAEQTRMATVVGVGEPIDDYTKCRYKKGDRVMIEFQSGTKLHLLSYCVMDEKFRVVFEEEILGKIEE